MLVKREKLITSPLAKALIFYHRAYITLSNPGRQFFLLGLFVLLIVFSVYYLYSDIIFFATSFAKETLIPYAGASNIDIVETRFLYKNIYILDMPGKYPSPLFSLFLFILSLVVIFFIRKTALPMPVVIWLIYVSLINLVSAAFFIILPHMFPYSIKEFSDLYMKIQTLIWLFIPLLMGATLSFLPTGILPKISVIIVTLLYSFVFGIVRYTVFLYILIKCSFVFMALMYFAFGPLVDFIYMVGIYSCFVSVIFLSKRARDLRVWKWVF